MSDIAIKIEGVGKSYTIGKQKDSSFRSALEEVLKPSISKGEDFWALKDVSFEVMKGEAIGIIGKNGAGKSTLLKILSQITRPSEGRIEINGRVASLLEVGTGFHPELTGRENIFLNGTILGMTRKEVRAKFDEIVEFSGVQKFIDTPVKHYSSGMYVRLAFAVAAHLDPEILIIDEVLAVGDAEFQKKCLGKMKDATNTGRTVLFVSHNISAIQNFCDKCILLENGKVSSSGDLNVVVKNYLDASSKNSKFSREEDKEIYFCQGEVEFDGLDQKKIELDLKVMSKHDVSCSLDVRILNNMETPIAFGSIGSLNRNKKIQLNKGKNSIKVSFETSKLAIGIYHIGLDLTDPDIKYFDRLNELIFEISKAPEVENARVLNSNWNLGNFELELNLLSINES
jgi:lipopolysaccharide transport system ATP-binding protein